MFVVDVISCWLAAALDAAVDDQDDDSGNFTRPEEATIARTAAAAVWC